MKYSLSLESLELKFAGNSIVKKSISHIELEFSLNKISTGRIQFTSLHVLKLDRAQSNLLQIGMLKFEFILNDCSYIYVTPIYRDAHSNYYLYTILISDKLYSLLSCLNNRVFCKKTLEYMMNELFVNIPYSCKFMDSSFKILNIVQYNESNFSFLMKLCTLYNLFIYMQDNMSYVIRDNLSSFDRYTQQLFVYSTNFHNISMISGVEVFNIKKDYKSQSKCFINCYLDVGMDKTEELDLLYKKYAASFQSPSYVEFNVATTDLLVGKVVKIDEAEYVVYQHNITISTDNNRSEITTESRIKCTLMKDLYISNSYTRSMNNLFIGRVVSSSSDLKNEIVFDKNYNVAVHLYMDKNKESYILARVLNRNALQNYGDFFPPRTGSEVVLMAVDEFLTNFLIIGSLYNTDNSELYNSKSISYIRTSEIGSPSSKDLSILENEISFEDKKGESKLSISARKDLLVRSKADSSMESENLDISVNKTVNLKCEDLNMDITNNYNIKAKVMNIECTDSVTLKVGTTSIKITPSSVSIQTVAQKIEVDASSVVVGQGVTAVTVTPAKIDIGSGASFQPAMVNIKGTVMIT